MNPMLSYISNRLQGTYNPCQARELAFLILEESWGCTRTQLLTDCKDTQKIPNLEIILQKLFNFEPIEYIFAHTEWMGLDLKLNRDTLIPRPETAELVQAVCAFGNRMDRTQPCRVVDVGTGSGCIALAIKQSFPHWMVKGIDISASAVEIAIINAQRNHLDVTFEVRDIFTDEIGEYDILVSNPPYVCECEKVDMLPNVLNFEPVHALFVPNDNPLRFYRQMAQAKAAKKVFFEINEAFGNDMCKLMQHEHYYDVKLIRDQYGKDRILTASMDI